MAKHEIDDKKSAVPFTARLIAYYRAIESRREDPLIVDPFAERLAGDMDLYFREHKRTRGTSDYAVVRTHYIDNHLLAPWCDKHERSQIVLLGAGLDARAYRVEPLRENEHTIFEIDFDLVNIYKENILQEEKPLCNLARVSADLSEPAWILQLEKAGFSYDIPTLWLLEGLVYYIDRDMVISVLQTAAMNCADESQIFADVCVPGLTLAQFGPFMMYFKWGLNKEDVSPFFAHSGWNVTCSYADDFDQGRDVGQRSLIFITGKRDLSTLGLPVTFGVEPEMEKIPESELKSYSVEFLMNIMPEIDVIIESYKREPDEGMMLYLEFIGRIKPIIQKIIKSLSTPLSIGHISSRLLRDPTTIELHSQEEKEAHVVGYLKAMLFLGYCVAKEIVGEKFQTTNIYSEGLKTGSVGHLQSFTKLVQNEIVNS